jgi:hypothetical protein
MAKSKFFRAFVEGQTISDGRKIEGPWIDQIVETFHAETYTPRINVEHLSGYSPEPPFNGYGSVIAVKAQTDDITIAGTVEKRRALYCQVDANDQLVALVAANQKPYTAKNRIHIERLAKVFPLDPDVYFQLVESPADDIRICSGCGCSAYDPCTVAEGPCQWRAPDACGACLDRAAQDAA